MTDLLLNPTKADFSPEGLLPLALHRAGDRSLNNKRIYRGPIDDALERAARLRKRRRLKPS